MAEYLLSLEQVKDLFDFVDEQTDETLCNHTLRYTKQWIDENIPAEQYDAVLAEIMDMGGYCDCEVLMNCYEEYDEELYGDED